MFKVRSIDLELLAGMVILIGEKAGLAGCEITTSAGEFEALILRKMGRSAPGPLAIFPCRSGAANQKAVSDCAKLADTLPPIIMASNMKNFLSIVLI